MDRFFAYARILTTGAPLPGATITIFNAGTQSLADIFDDDLAQATPKANPFLADQNGFFFFYAAAGYYDVRIEGGSVNETPYTWGDVPVGDAHTREHELASATTLGADHTVSGLTVGDVLTAISDTDAAFQPLPAGKDPEHGNLVGLADDDHPQYGLLAGRASGQDLAGGIAASEKLTLRGTANATPGNVEINPDGGNVSVGAETPAEKLDVAGKVRSRSGGFVFPDGTVQITSASAGSGSPWSVSGDNIFNANVGRVGIGTSTPAGGKLHVLQSLAGFPTVRLEQAAGAGEASVELFLAGTRVGLIAANASRLRLIAPGTDPAKTLIMTNDGRVGINTLSPQKNGLHVASLTESEPLRVESPPGQHTGVELFTATADRGRLRANAQFIGILNRSGRGVTVDQVTDRVGVGLSQSETPVGRLAIRGDESDPLELRVESLATTRGATIELFDANFQARRGLLQADATRFRMVSASGNGNLYVDHSSGFFAVGKDVSEAPTRRLSVYSTAGEALPLHLQTETGGASGLDMFEGAARRGQVRATSTVVEIANGAGVVVSINQSDSRVGIGVAAPTEALDVSGNVHAASFPTSSDERFKTDVRPLDPCLHKLRRLQAVTYRWNDFYRHELGRGDASDAAQIGFIAQAVEKVFPELVRHWSGNGCGEDEPGGRYRGLDYQRMVPVVVEAVKELAERVERLEAQGVP